MLRNYLDVATQLHVMTFSAINTGGFFVGLNDELKNKNRLKTIFIQGQPRYINAIIFRKIFYRNITVR